MAVASLPAEGYVTGSIRTHVMRISGVMIFGFLAMTAGNLIEVLYIGQVGKISLAAYTFVFPVAMCLNAMTRGIGVGASAVVAQQMGVGNDSGARQIATFGFVLVLVFTVSLAIAGQFLSGWLFGSLGADDQVLLQAEEYAGIWLIGFPLMGIAMVSNGLIRSFGDPTYPGYIMSSGPIVQVAVGPFLIFGWLGLPTLGLNGAGWAMVIGSAVQVACAAHWFLFKHRRLTTQFSGFFDASLAILHVGIPAAATNVIQPFSFVVVTWLLADFGASVVAAFGVAARIEAILSMVVVGVSTAVVPMVGQNWSARLFLRVEQTLFTCYASSHLIGVVAALLMAVLAPLCVAVINSDPDLVDAAVLYLYILPISIGFMGMIIIATNAFNAVRKPMPALILSISRLLIVFIPTALILKGLMGYPGVFVAIALSNVVVGVAAWAWCRSVIRRERLVLSEERTNPDN